MALFFLSIASLVTECACASPIFTSFSDVPSLVCVEPKFGEKKPILIFYLQEMQGTKAPMGHKNQTVFIICRNILIPIAVPTAIVSSRTNQLTILSCKTLYMAVSSRVQSQIDFLGASTAFCEVSHKVRGHNRELVDQGAVALLFPDDLCIDINTD